MKLLLSELPKSDWWGTGTPEHLNNWMTKKHLKPRQEIIARAHAILVETLLSIGELTVVPFPEGLDSPRCYAHDFIFVRDSYISNGRREVLMSNFSERSRQAEAQSMRVWLQCQGYAIHTVSTTAYAEGGEFHYLLQEQLLLAGINRNNKEGIDAVSKFLEVKDVCIIKTDAYHLDTNVGIVRDVTGKCCAVLACRNAIENYPELERWCIRHGLQLIPLDSSDGMGNPKIPGSFAVNGLAIPGFFVSCAYFQTPGVEDVIASRGVRHLVVPLDDLTFTGGAVHCLTNEL